MSNRFTDGPFSDDELKTIFTTKVGNDLMKSDPAMYQLAKATAIQKGILGPGRVNDGRLTKAPVTAQKEITPAQQAAMIEYDRETCAAYFGANTNRPGARNAGQLAKENPEAYQRLKLAAQGHGIIPDNPTVVVRDNSHAAQLAEKQSVPTVQTNQDGEHRFRLADSIADEAGVTRGTFVSMKEFGKITQQLSINKAAAAAKARATQPTDAPATTEPEAPTEAAVTEAA